MKTRPFASDLEPAWNDFNRRARNGHFMFDRSFMTYHSDRFQDASLVVTEDDRIVALLPANRSADRIVSHQGLTFGGLVVDDARTEQITRALDACEAHFAAEGFRSILYKPLPWIYHRRPSQEDLYWLARRGARLARREITTAIRLGRPGAISQRRRRGATKAERSALRYNRSERYDEMWEILSEVLAERHGTRPVHSLNEITGLAAKFPENISLHTAESPGGDKVLAGVVLFTTPEVAHVQYMATSAEGRLCGALDGLLLAVIQGCKDQTYFDFGISTEDEGRFLNLGLIRQKEEFGGSGVVHDQYELSLDA